MALFGWLEDEEARRVVLPGEDDPADELRLRQNGAAQGLALEILQALVLALPDHHSNALRTTPVHPGLGQRDQMVLRA